MKKLYTLFLITVFLAGCNKDGQVEIDQPMTPQITLDSEDGIYTVKVGRELTIAPTVQYAENALFSWTLDGKLLSTEPTLTHTWSEAAEVYVMFTVQNENGKAEEELKVVVVEMGMRGRGQIAALCDFVRPDWGLITNVGESHIELLGSRENIRIYGFAFRGKEVFIDGGDLEMA